MFKTKKIALRFVIFTISFWTLLAYVSNLSAAIKTKDDLINEAKTLITEISPEEAYEKIQANPDIFILDVRQKYDEYDKGHIKNSVIIPRGFIEFAIDNNDLFPEINKGRVPTKDQQIFTFCKLGGRGILAAKVLKEMGYTNVYNIKGGLQSWMKAKLPLEK